MLRAASADEDQSHAVLGRLRVADRFVVAAPLALHVLSALQCRILDALGVNLEVFSAQREVGAIDAVVNLAEFRGALVVVAQLALEEQKAPLIVSVFLRVEHVVAL